MRIGEALAVRTEDFDPDCQVRHVRRSVWRRCEQAPKTPNAIRLVDISETWHIFYADTQKGRMATSSRREPDGFLTSATHSKRCTEQGIEVDSTPFGAFALRSLAGEG